MCAAVFVGYGGICCGCGIGGYPGYPCGIDWGGKCTTVLPGPENIFDIAYN